MAFPTSFSSLIKAVSFAPPFLSSSGNVYVVGIHASTGSLVRVIKATDPSSSFSSVSTTVDVTNAITKVAACQLGDVLHIVSRDSASSQATMRYHQFNMATDSWSVTGELIKGPYGDTPLGGTTEFVGIAARSNGDVVVLYNGSSQAVMGNRYDRTHYARRVSGTWTIDVSVDGASSTVNWYGNGLVTGSSDRTHLFIQSASSGHGHRTLTSANALQTLTTGLASGILPSGGGILFSQPAAYVASGGSTKIVQALDDSGSSVTIISFDSADAPTYSVDSTDATGADTPVGSGDGTYSLSLAVDDSTSDVIYLDYQSGSNTFKRTKNSGAGWETPWSVTVSGLTNYHAASRIYTRGGNVVVAHHTYSHYSEETISTGGTAVGQDLSGSYAISAAVGADGAGSYAIAATVGQDSAGSYAVLNAAGQDQAGAYAVIEAVGANHAGSYGIGGTVSADHAGTYAIQATVGQDGAGSYAVLSAVGQDQAGSYGVVEFVGQSQSGSYGVVAAVGADGSGSYAVHEAVGQDSAGSYAIAEAVGADLAGTYGIVAAVGADHAGGYAIAEVVGQDQPGAYGIAETVQSDHAGAYSVVEAVGQDQSGGWAIVEVVGQSLAGAYNIEATGAVGNDLAGAYGIAEVVGADCAGGYGVVEAVGQDQGGAYGVVEAVGADQAGAYVVAAVVGEDMPGTYGIAQTVGQDQAGAYAVLESAGADQAGAYAIVGAVGANLAGSYAIDGTTSATLYFVSHVTGTVSTPANALGAPDGVFTTDANAQTNWTSRWRLDTVAGSNQPNGTQSISLRMRKGSNSGNPTVSSVTLYQGGVSLGALTLTSGSTTISSTTGQDLVYEFSGSLLAGMADVDIEIATAGAGGTPGQRNAASIDAGTWAAAYQVVQAVGVDLSGGYAIVHAVGQDQPGAYAVIEAVGADLSAGYAVVESVGRDLAGAYSVSEGLTAVGSDLAQAYAVLSEVGADLPGTYGIAGQVGQDIAGSYGITATVTSDQPGDYRVLVSVASDGEGGYSVFEVAGADLVQAYALAAQVASDLAGGYAVEGSGAPAPFSAIEARINRAMFALLSDTEATLDGAAVTGIFEDGYAHGSAGAIGMADTQPVFIVPTASITGEAVGQLLVANSQTYIVGAHEPDGTGVSRLILERAS